MREKACMTAVTGHKRDEGIAIRGTVTVRCPNWIVLLHLTRISKLEPEKVKSERVKKVPGLKSLGEIGRRWLLRKRPKNETKHIAQKEACLLSDKWS